MPQDDSSKTSKVDPWSDEALQDAEWLKDLTCPLRRRKWPKWRRLERAATLRRLRRAKLVKTPVGSLWIVDLDDRPTSCSTDD